MEDVDMEDVSELPTADECQRRSEQFANITNTDTALAMMFLQDTGWDLEVAVNNYFQQMGIDPAVSSGDAPSAKSGYTFSFPQVANESKRIRVMSWNLDGLDSHGLSGRTEFAIQCIRLACPHILLLQEVVSETEKIFRRELNNDYQFVVDSERCDYFCMALFHKKYCNVEGFSTSGFDNSVMGRGLIAVKAQIKDVPCMVMTSHLESTRPHAESRKVQLKLVWDKMVATDDRNVVFGGDLNLRDNEVTELNGVPRTVEDVWESCGRREEAKNSWDPKRNTNAGSKTGGRGLRFDRMYLRRLRNGKQLNPVYFELGGIEKLPQSSSRFASDHWAIICHFDIVS